MCSNFGGNCYQNYNLPKLTKDSLNGLTLLVSTASVERSLSQMKLIKTFQASLQLVILCQHWPYLILSSTDSSQFPTYGKKIEVLLNHYRKDKFALTLNEETVKTAVISPFRTLLAKKPEDSIAT